MATLNEIHHRAFERALLLVFRLLKCSKRYSGVIEWHVCDGKLKGFGFKHYETLEFVFDVDKHPPIRQAENIV